MEDDVLVPQIYDLARPATGLDKYKGRQVKIGNHAIQSTAHDNFPAHQ
ncbi:hypothetical protein [Hyphomonas chukchiensis]|uniref:Uncharacterized protein n=1 Tax=Hyphomonas chukchiensis TaxID=1280947 RepID=A0A062U9S6_9PROT|nr:hypothetical protein [Hyphomonas chukchiensis]KCZ57101.1 hypothetical protein HY30_17650 [Hyphomonas chukchiensis]